MKLYEKKSKLLPNKKRYEGVKRGFDCSIIEAIDNKGWYFCVHKQDKTFSYNSTWDNLRFESVEDTRISCEEYIMKIIKGEVK